MPAFIPESHGSAFLPATTEKPEPRHAIEKMSRWLSVLVVGGTLAGVGALLFSTTEEAHAERPDVIRPVPALAAKVAAAEARTRSTSPATQPWIVPPPVQRSKAQERVEPPASAAPVVPQPLPPSALAPEVKPAPDQPAPALADTAAVPTRCLPAELRTVLKDVEARFGAVTLVSTTELRTDNHSRGSVRHHLHAACKAIDFKVAANAKAVVAFLRSRPEVAGTDTYGNSGVIHIDLNEGRRLAQR